MPEIEKEKSIIPLYKEDMMTAKENGAVIHGTTTTARAESL